MSVWIVDLVLAVGTFFVLVVAATIEWDQLSNPWRRVVACVALQQAAIAYGAAESLALHVPVTARVYVLACSMLALLLSAALVLVDRRRHDRPQPRRVRR